MAPPARRAATNPWRSCIRSLPLRWWLEFFLEAAVEGAPGPELGREDPEPGPVPELVLLVPYIDDVESGGHLPERGERELLLDPDVGLLVRRDRGVVRVHDGASETAAGQEIKAEAGVCRRQEVGGARGRRDQLVVIGVVEGGVEDGGPELPVVEEVLGLLVVDVEADLEAREDLLDDPRVEVVRPLGPDDGVLGDLGLGGGAYQPVEAG